MKKNDSFQMCQSVMLSPGEITKKVSKEYDRKREEARERKSTIEFKKRRREKRSSKVITRKLVKYERQNRMRQQLI